MKPSDEDFTGIDPLARFLYRIPGWEWINLALFIVFWGAVFVMAFLYVPGVAWLLQVACQIGGSG